MKPSTPRSNRPPGAERRRYRVNLSGQQACCEANYARLLKLMPAFEKHSRWEYQLEAGAGRCNIRLQVTERQPYTTMLEVSQQPGGQQPAAPEATARARGDLSRWGAAPRLQVRLYHDARMAEVVAWQHHRQLQPRYDYPNRNMYQRDEKAQFNQFLEDWLSHSLAHGQSCETVDL